MKRTALILMAAFLAAGCTGVPKVWDSCGQLPSMTPDYSNVVIPRNIAPMNFIIDTPGDRFVTVLKSDAGETVLRGRTVKIPMRRWRRLLESDSISINVFVQRDGQWIRMKQFSMTASDPIDRYVTYRLIPPSFQQYEDISICQRDLESFGEKAIYRNMAVMKPARGQGQCVNCHSFQNYGTENFQLHLRQYEGGTVIVHDGKVRKVNLKRSQTAVSTAVYPSWHPFLPLVAYSTNSTVQYFHTSHPDRVEVFDDASDLVLYNVETDVLTPVLTTPDRLECFPSWSQDGRTLYYVQAVHDIPDGEDRHRYTLSQTDSIRYDIYAMPFNTATMEWGAPYRVFNASAAGCSATHPRLSPDGRRLMFSLGSHGIFHVWHNDADLWMLDMTSGQARALDELNSDRAESYHSWSHDGRWVIFGSRREDGEYTRLFISHLQPDGTFSKPFTIPQKDPHSNSMRVYSYNIPEFTTERVKYGPRRLLRAMR